MDANLEYALTRLDKDAILRIDAGQGRSVVVLRGAVWITQDGDLRDVFVDEGESFRLDRPGRALVQALRASSVLVDGAEAAAERSSAAAATGPYAASHRAPASGAAVQRVDRHSGPVTALVRALGQRVWLALPPAPTSGALVIAAIAVASGIYQVWRAPSEFATPLVLQDGTPRNDAAAGKPSAG